MAKRSERVTRMIENFYSEWKAGKSLLEIADKYRITRRTIYENLQEIADKNGVQREELLEKPHKLHKKRVQSEHNPVTFSCEEIQEEVEELIEQTKLVISDIDKVLND